MTRTDAINGCTDLHADDPMREIVRHANGNDLSRIVAIHQKAFRYFFLTRLGEVFLHRYYELVLGYGAGIILVSERGASVDGFVCGFVNPPEFYQRMWRKASRFIAPGLRALAGDPSLAAGVVHGVQRIWTSASRARPGWCELASIAVMPEVSGLGLGRRLVEAFVARARFMNAQCVYLTTDANGNASANALYRQVGFRRTHQFLQRKGRWMNEYVLCCIEEDR